MTGRAPEREETLLECGENDPTFSSEREASCPNNATPDRTCSSSAEVSAV
jgi:hypothetical protein